MALPDFTQTVIDYLTNGTASNNNWLTANYDPQPTLVDADEWRRDSDDKRIKGVELTQANAITVDSSPTGTKEAIGTEFDHKVRFGTAVTVEALHAEGGGEVDDKDDFDSLVTEAQRAILANRTRPPVSSGQYGFTHLDIEEVSDESPTGVEHAHVADLGEANHFSTEFTVWFYGFEDLP